MKLVRAAPASFLSVACALQLGLASDVAVWASALPARKQATRTIAAAFIGQSSVAGSASQSDAYLGPAGRADDESLHRSILCENGRNWRDRRRLTSSACASTASE